jgi:predicted transcriptional regulator
MRKKFVAKKLVEFLKKRYGENIQVEPLNKKEVFKVLIGTILSQRTRDENTDKAASALFAKAKIKEKMKIFNGKKTREKYQIIEKILDKAVDGVKKSHLLPKEDGCNLSFTQLQYYLLNLGKTNMIALNDRGCKTTPKGQMFTISHELQQSFLETGRKEDPYLNPELIAQIEAALSPMLKVRIPPTTTVAFFEEPIIIGK